MKYLVSEEELKELFWWYNNHDITVDDTIKDFLKSKQPVGEIEAGTVEGDFGYDLGDKLVKHYGKKVRILVEVSK